MIAHGLGEHSGRYVHVGDFFARAGFTAFAFDLRGHGSSEGNLFWRMGNLGEIRRMDTSLLRLG